MHRIRDWLYTGGIAATENTDGLKVHQITAMLQLHHAVEQPGIASRFIYIEDARKIPKHQLEQGIDFIQQQHAADGVILVACGAGVSRSVTLATAALVVVEGLALVEAFTVVRAGNPRAMPDQTQWQSLAQYFDDDTDFWDLWMRLKM